MAWHILAWPWLANAAVGGLIVLAVGGLAVRLCRQPVRRARLVVLTMLAAVMVPWLGMVPLPLRIPVALRWSAGLLSPTESGPSSNSIEGPSHIDPEVRRLAPGPSGESVSAAQPVANRTDPGAGRWASSALSILTALPWHRVVLVAHASASAGLLGWWVLGQIVLWRITQGSRPVRPSVRDRFLTISGATGENVRLLESDRIGLPVTFTWARPVILLPSDLCGCGDEEALQYALAHEWSHVERRDAWIWNLAAVAGVLLFYQPLFWWLRRQLRLCQDYLADDRAAALGSPEDYAACLVRLARERGDCRAGHRAFAPALPAMGIHDRPSNLTRRIHMLINDRGPIEHRCPRTWSLGAAAATVVAILAVAGLRADDTSARDPKPQDPTTTPVKAVADPKGAALHYSGTVKDKHTDKPIAGAIVIVRRMAHDANGSNRVIEATRHTTNAEGVYSFTIPPEQAAEKSLYIELDVEHPDYATRAGFSYSLALIRQDEAKGQRPFFANIALRPAKAVFGRVETPDGKPLEGAEIVAFSLPHKVRTGPLEDGSFARVKTDRDGRFRVPITTPGLGVFWIVPRNFAPELHEIPADRRGDLGTFTVKKGMTVTGRAIDAQGKPLDGMFVDIRRDYDRSPDRQVLESLGVSDMIKRKTETDAEGRFTLDPLPAGVYVLEPVKDRDVPGKGLIRRPLPGVFAPQTATITEGRTPEPLTIRASQYVVIEGGWVDSQGKPRRGSQLMFFGHLNGQTWHTLVDPSADGQFSVKVPRGMEDVQITLFLGSLASTRYRIGKDAKLQAGQFIMFGTRGLDHDVKDLQIVHYDPTGVIVKETTKDGRPIQGVILAGKYTSELATAGGGFVLENGESSEIRFKRQVDGRFRATEITPDRELKITAYADGFQPASRTVKIPEGKTEAVTFVMEPK